MQGAILWENPNPSANFAAQDIVLSSDDYDVLEVYYKLQTTNNFMMSVKVLKGYSVYLCNSGGENGVGPINVARALRYDSPTVYYFADAQRSFGNVNTTNNAYAIPVKIIGYKS